MWSQILLTTKMKDARVVAVFLSLLRLASQRQVSKHVSVQSDTSDFGFEVQDSSNFQFPLSVMFQVR